MLPESEALPEDRGYGGDIEDKDEILDEFSHPSTLTPSAQDVYEMDQLRKDRKRY